MFRLRLVMVASLVVAAAGLVPAASAAPGPGGAPELVAFLDGKPIPLADVSRYYCDDFAFPTITCSSSRVVIDARATMSLLAGVTYVTIYEYAVYAGSYMHVSQEYSVLAFIGWNDRISSFRARNSETGRFWTDWLMSGTQWPFCCNSLVPGLGAYDNTFSSVEPT